MKQFHDAKVFNTDFHLSLFQNYSSLTHETRIKDAVNMGDLMCLLATVRTLNNRILFISGKLPMMCAARDTQLNCILTMNCWVSIMSAHVSNDLFLIRSSETTKRVELYLFMCFGMPLLSQWVYQFKNCFRFINSFDCVYLKI